jgi:hypothetical protein
MGGARRGVRLTYVWTNHRNPEPCGARAVVASRRNNSFSNGLIALIMNIAARIQTTPQKPADPTRVGKKDFAVSVRPHPFDISRFRQIKVCKKFGGRFSGPLNIKALANPRAGGAVVFMPLSRPPNLLQIFHARPSLDRP